MIKAQGLKKSYNNHLGNEEVIFKGLDFEAKRGEVTVIMGPSGSGKTTLLNMLSTIDNVEEGSLLIGDLEISQMKEHSRARFRAKNIGFIFQNYALISEFSLLENCIIPLSMSGVKREEAIRKTKLMIQHFFPEDINVNKFPSELSGGQQQRVAIARALVHGPVVVIADEPTGNLDEKTSYEVKRHLHELASSYNKCVVIVTHDKDYLNYANKVYSFEYSQDKGYTSTLVLE